jgi:hypothetical protein
MHYTVGHKQSKTILIQLIRSLLKLTTFFNADKTSNSMCLMMITAMMILSEVLKPLLGH